MLKIDSVGSDLDREAHNLVFRMLGKQDGARQAPGELLDLGRLHIHVELAKEASSSSHESEVAMSLLFCKLLLDAAGRSLGTWPSLEGYI